MVMALPDVMELADLAATASLAARVAGQIRQGDALLLEGPFGAGKTEFARQLLRHLSAEPALEVPSPSYTLVQSYETRIGMVHHLDLWRLSGPGELMELGWEEMLADVVVVEWAERLGPWRPDGAVTIVLHPVSESVRRATITGWADRF
jgi:tRNA threonylcarbamoyladenosine biosynthesis protein TsaE